MAATANLRNEPSAESPQQRVSRALLGWINSNILDGGDYGGGPLHRPSKDLKKRYAVIRLLERGGHGDIWLCQDKLSHSRVACKVLAHPSKARLKGQQGSAWEAQVALRHVASIEREVTALRKLSATGHSGVVRLLEVLESRSKTEIVMEYCESGDLHEMILKRGPLPEEEAKVLFTQLACAVRFCHSRGLLHRDLKAENVLLAPTSALPGGPCDVRAKLCDFGLAADVGDGGHVEDAAGSKYWMAPEVTRGEKYGAKADVWGLGLVLFAMLTGNLPRNSQRMKEAHQIWTGMYSAPIELGFLRRTHFPRHLQDLLKKMLEFDPRRRIDLWDVLTHPWLTGIGMSQKDVPLGLRGIPEARTVASGLVACASSDSLGMLDASSSVCSSPFSGASPASRSVTMPKGRELLEEGDA